MVKIGFSLQTQYDIPMSQVIPLLKAAGFSALSPVWAYDSNIDSLAESIYHHDMTIQSLHGPRQDNSLLWTPDAPDSTELQNRLFHCVDDCARLSVPILVLHSWQGFTYTFLKESLNFSFFDRLVSYAGEKNVSIAFENLEGEEFLVALLERYQDHPNTGYCWDSGHDYCYPHKTDFLGSFADQLIMTHINDNLGARDPNGNPLSADDLHFLPFDGIIPWEHTLTKLKNAPKQEILNFEFKTRSHSCAPSDLLYANLPTEEFFALAGERAHRIATLYECIMNEK